MLYFYTTDNATQNQEAYNTFIESFIPLLASVPCPKCGMIEDRDINAAKNIYKLK